MARRQTEQTGTRQAALVGMALVLVVLLSLVAGSLGPRLIQAAFPGTDAADAAPEWVWGLYNLLASLLAFLPPIAFLLHQGRPLGLRLVNVKGRIPVLVLLPLFLGLMVAANSLSNILRNLVLFFAGGGAATPDALPATILGHLFYFLTICVAAPLLEEILFRGCIQGLLRVWGPGFAILLTSVLFTLMHATLWELPTVFILSLLLCYVGEVSRSLRPCVLLHFANNLYAWLMALAREKLAPTVYFAITVWVMVALIALFLAAVWLVRQYRLGPRLKLPAAPEGLGRPAVRIKLLARVVPFAVGFAALLGYCILRLVSG
ncbi:CPBP family intramembrane metalloprotease [Ruminococcaceae bacterium OttesenSCG-928-O06]|nr:CPBP family intramembrane metalloprotease [Ruminococcaceae bacterium OttesenSCG-928-O06]